MRSANQDFEAGHYHLIIALVVLHAIRSLEKPLIHVRSLLKLGVRLNSLENAQRCDDMHLIFRTLLGWWLSETERRGEATSFE